ncbi:DUF3592 domain-containing protein [Chloroflexota bacterium]|nr:DUF3592 domain-containing protein [Chloroflexota bacterium]
MTSTSTGWVGPMIAVGIGGVLGIIGIVLIILYFRNKAKSKASQSWPSVMGQIVERKVKVDTSYDEDGISSTSYLPQVTYSYTANGAVYESHRVAFGSTPSFNSNRKAEEFLTPYIEGASVTVFYNPEKPEESVLTQTMRSMTAGLVVGIIFVVVMACLFCVAGVGVVRLLQ